LPSITSATCRGTRLAGMPGGLAPLTCGSGGLTGRLTGILPGASCVLHVLE